MNFVRFIYSLVIGIIFAILVGVGVYTFYTPPERNYDMYESYPTYPQGGTQAQIDAYEAAADVRETERKTREDEFQAKFTAYVKKAAAIINIAAVVALLIAVIAPLRPTEVKDGFAIGAVATGIYASILAASGNHKAMLFISMCITLAAAIIATYSKFSEDTPQKAKR